MIQMKVKMAEFSTTSSMETMENGSVLTELTVIFILRKNWIERKGTITSFKFILQIMLITFVKALYVTSIPLWTQVKTTVSFSFTFSPKTKMITCLNLKPTNLTLVNNNSFCFFRVINFMIFNTFMFITERRYSF